jgi:hypothetical protein
LADVALAVLREMMRKDVAHLAGLAKSLSKVATATGGRKKQ